MLDVLEIRPLPGMPVIRDLAVDQSLLFKQYERVQPWLINDTPNPAIERLQSPEDRAKLETRSAFSAAAASATPTLFAQKRTVTRICVMGPPLSRRDGPAGRRIIVVHANRI